MGARRYDNTLREQQAERTRERILDAVIDALSRQEDPSVAELAAAAGVSVPTVYRHFPTREALLDAVQQEIGRRMRRPAWDGEALDLPASAAEHFRWFEEHAVLVRAIVSSALGRELLRTVRARRDQAIGRAVRRRLRGLSRGRARAVTAILGALHDPRTWHALREEASVADEDAAWVVAWATGALLDRVDEEGR